MLKTHQYRMRVPSLKIYSLTNVPKAGETFTINDAQLRYEIELRDPYIITYCRDVTEQGAHVSNERVSIMIRGHVVRKYQTLLQGDTLLIVDRFGGFVILYRVKDGTSHFMNDDVTILLEGMCVEERKKGDQLVTIYVPDHFKAYKVSPELEEIIAPI